MTTAPTRAPWFCNAFAGYERTFPDTREEAADFINDIARTADIFPHWRIDQDGGLDVQLAVVERIDRQLTVIRAATAAGDIVLRFSWDPSGFVLVTADRDGAEVFRAYIDRPYEEYDVWPPGAGGDNTTDAPGRIGKKRSWVSLSTKGWPVLLSLAEETRLNVQIADD